jgi:hypothetical protein
MSITVTHIFGGKEAVSQSCNFQKRQFRFGKPAPDRHRNDADGQF